MATAKQLDRISTIIGAIMVGISLIIVVAPMFVDVKKDYTETWSIPITIGLIGLGLIGCNAKFFNALGNLFDRKANNL